MTIHSDLYGSTGDCIMNSFKVKYLKQENQKIFFYQMKNEMAIFLLPKKKILAFERLMFSIFCIWKLIQIQKPFSKWNIFFHFVSHLVGKNLFTLLIFSYHHYCNVCGGAHFSICSTKVLLRNQAIQSFFFNPTPKAHTAAVLSKRNTSYHFILCLPYLLECNPRLEYNPLPKNTKTTPLRLEPPSLKSNVNWKFSNLI